MRILVLAALAAFALPSVAAAQSNGGFYAGLTLGANVSVEENIDTVGTAAFRTLVPSIAPGSLNAEADDSAAIGAIVGYAFPSAGGVRFGVEADLAAANLEGDASFSGAPIAGLAPAGLTTSAKRELSTLGTVRGRIGFPVSDTVELFGAGGFAFGEAETTASVVVNGATTVRWDGSTSDTLTGWTLGAGADIALNDRFSLRGEYLYYDLGDQTVTAAGNAAVRGVAALNGIDYVARSEYTGGVLRAAFVAKF